MNIVAGFDYSDYDFSYLIQFQRELSQIKKSISALYTPEYYESIKSIQAMLKEANTFQLQHNECLDEFRQAIASIKELTLPSDTLKELSEMVKFYQSSTIQNQMKETIRLLSEGYAPALTELSKSLSISDYHINEDDTLTFDGITYSSDEIKAELDEQIADVNGKKISLREKAENLQKKLWVLLLIVRLIVFAPDVPDIASFYDQVIEKIESVVAEQQMICYTIKEQSYIKNQPSSSADIVMILQYDTPLEIMEEIPRWYQVKYTDETGVELIGWISKISVEREG